MGKVNIEADASVIVVYANIRCKDTTVIPKMALDTGATYVMIPWEIAETLGTNPELAKEKVDIITASGVEKAPIVILESISVLGETATRVKAVVHDLPQKSYVDGLLGLSFLKNFELNIDFKKGFLELK